MANVIHKQKISDGIPILQLYSSSYNIYFIRYDLW